MRFRLLIAWNINTVIFSPFLFSGYCIVNHCVVCVVSGLSNFNICFFFNVVFKSSYRCMDTKACESFFFFLFMTHIVYLCHFSDIRLYAPSLVFLFSGPFMEVLPPFTLRIVSRISRGGEPWCLSRWWDFCYIVRFRVAFSLTRGTLFSFFLSTVV